MKCLEETETVLLTTINPSELPWCGWLRTFINIRDTTVSDRKTYTTTLKPETALPVLHQRFWVFWGTARRRPHEPGTAVCNKCGWPGTCPPLLWHGDCEWPQRLLRSNTMSFVLRMRWCLLHHCTKTCRVDLALIQHFSDVLYLFCCWFSVGSV